MKESRLLILQTSSSSEDEGFEQYGYLLLRGDRDHPGRVDVISVSNPQTLDKPLEFDNESLAIEAIEEMHPGLVTIPSESWRQWGYT
jgi:hypothetical protein